jgi:hypothetical protein
MLDLMDTNRIVPSSIVKDLIPPFVPSSQGLELYQRVSICRNAVN